MRFTLQLLTLLALTLSGAAQAGESALHSLWELHGAHNTVYLLGSIHVLRASDYPLAPAIVGAYEQSASVYMEVDPQDLDRPQLQADMLASAAMPNHQTLPAVLGTERYVRAQALARSLGVELTTFDSFAPWFAAEAISELQLVKLGFDAQSGVDMYFFGRARHDGKPVAGLETVQDQIGLFQAMPMGAQAQFLLASLEEAHDLPQEVDAMVRAWQGGDTAWFVSQVISELGRDPQLYRTLLVARNRKWIPQIEALLGRDKNCLVIVGTAHLVGPDSVIEMLKRDGIGATQR